jgi:hypothetical protein
LLVVAASTGLGQAAAADEDDALPLSRGFGYLGAFWVTRVETKLSLFSTDLPVGVRVDLNKDLGLRNSFTIPRATLGWRFGKRHLVAGGFYNLSRDGGRTLDEEIELPGGIVIPIGAEIGTSFQTEIGKVQYTYLFHRDRKVTLGVGAGLFIARLGLGVVARGNVGGGEEFADFDESVTAPLPVLGFRLTYQVNPKWIVLLSSDVFLLNYNDEYKGLLTDTQLYASHRTFKHVGFAAGLNLQTFNVQIDDDELFWELDEGLVGFLAAVTFYF